MRLFFGGGGNLWFFFRFCFKVALSVGCVWFGSTQAGIRLWLGLRASFLPTGSLWILPRIYLSVFLNAEGTWEAGGGCAAQQPAWETAPTPSLPPPQPQDSLLTPH